MAVTQQSYVDSNSKVKAARKKLAEAQSKLDSLSRAQVPSGAGSKVAADVAARVAEAKKTVESAKGDVQAIETKARNYFDQNAETIQGKAESKAAAKKESNLASGQTQIEAMQRAGIDVTAAKKLTEKVKTRVNQPEQTPVTGETGGGAGGGTGLQVEDFASTLKGARNELKKMSDSDRITLAQGLKDAGYDVPVTGVFTDALLGVYQAAISAAQGAYNANKEFSTLKSFLDDRKAQVAAINAAGGGGSSSFEKTISISAPTEARAVIQQQFQNVLGRDATEEELAKYTEKLNAAEKKNASIARGYSSSTGKGSSRSTTYTGGLDKAEFLAEQIKKLPEYAQKKEEKASLTSQSIQKTINANGLNLPADQVAAWTKAVQNGTKLDVVLNQIRQIASAGMPDNVKKLLNEGTDLSTIYSPYKQTMAATLELDPNAINLNDPILRTAIGPSGEMPIYDFQRQLRKDARWQYTNNARKEVSDSVSKVLQDFGFMG
jgi:hypothetical protein